MDLGAVGSSLVWLALAGFVTTTVVALASLRHGRSDRHATPVARSAWILFRVSVLASLAATSTLAWALVTVDPALTVVAEVSARGRPWYERVAGLWGASRPSLLLWTAMLGIAVWLGGRRIERFAATLAVGGAVLAGLSAIVVLAATPFRRPDIPAIDGQGLAPILRHPFMLIHPPLLYTGQVAAAVLAIVTAGAVLGRGDLTGVRGWMRRGALITVSSLSAALTLGGAWAFIELGWGGFWAWDPVENAGLLPWLAAVALLHTLRAGSIGRACAALALTAGVASFAGATLTRAGVGVSVHAFTPHASVGRSLTALLAVGALGSVAVVRRIPRASAQEQARPRPSVVVHRVAVVSVLMILIVVAIGTAVPIIDESRTVRGTFFARFTWPMAVVVLIGVGIGPVIARGTRLRDRSVIIAIAVGVVSATIVATSTRSAFAAVVAAAAPLSAMALARNGARAASFAAHAGVLLLLVGVAATSAGADSSEWLRPGERMRVQGYEVEIRSIEGIEGKGRTGVAATVVVRRRGNPSVVLRPSAQRWAGWAEPLAETASTTTPQLVTVQVVLRRVVPGVSPNGTAAALVDVHVRPLLGLVWVGAALIASGTAVQVVRRRRPPTPPH